MARYRKALKRPYLERMGFLKKRLLRRFGPAGKLADVAIVGGAALRMAQRKGLITEETANKFGSASSSGGEAVSAAEMMLIAGALWRLLRKMVSSRKTERIVIDV